MVQSIGRRGALAGILVPLTSILTVALAQPGRGPGMMGGGYGMMGGRWNMDSYLSSLKTELGITEKQEPAWKEYADTVSGVQAQMQGLHETMFEAMGTASWQERRDMMNKMFEARQQAFESVHEAATKLMSDLDPGQKTKARNSLPGLGFGPGMRGGGGPGTMGGRGPGPMGGQGPGMMGGQAPGTGTR